VHPSASATQALDAIQLVLLDRLTSALIQSLQLRDRLDAVLAFFVPETADWAFITMPDEQGEQRIAARLHPLGLPTEVNGNPVILPLKSRGENVGSLHLGFAERAPFASDEFLTTCADRIAQALYNARLYEREQRVSLTFQNAALSARLPDVPGYRFSATYEAGRAEALVGGDWYDAFQLADGRFVISIGDVQGSGLEAAVAMMNVRQTLRGVAHIHADPVRMLEAADRALQEQHRERFVTTVVAVVDPVTQSCAYANAGHPPPLLRLSDGTVQTLQSRGVPLGIPDFSKTIEAQHLHLPPHSLLLLYTDGIIESSRDILEGEARLEQALRALVPAGDAAARDLYNAVLPCHSRDDVAILTMYVDTSAPIRRWRYDPQWHDVASRVRDEICDELVTAGFGPVELFDFETIFAELMANLVRYAPGTSEVLLESSSRTFILHVLDTGPGFQFSPHLPNDLFSQSGRGLFLVSHLSTEFNVERRPGGGSHARVALNAPKRKKGSQ
jgi:anti-sigma regulatory factor (Ser/Thr protein kinase)